MTELPGIPAPARRLVGNLRLSPAGEEQDPQRPSVQDLTECISFSPEEGRVWLHDQRVILMRTSTMGEMRRELVASLGEARARGILTRLGYSEGVRDAEFARSLGPEVDPISTALAGAKLHALEGGVKVVPVHLAFDAERGLYEGEFLNLNSAEADEVVASQGLVREPACWGLVGRVTGYVSNLLGKLIIFREVECRAQGAAACRIIGRPAEEWPDVEEDLQ